MKRTIILLTLISYLGTMHAQVLYAEKEDKNGKVGYRTKAKEMKVKAAGGAAKTAHALLSLAGVVGGTDLTKGLEEAAALPQDMNTLSAPDIPLFTWDIPPMYDAVQKEFNDNLAAVVVNGRLGFVNTHNQMVIAPQFENTDELDGFAQGLAAVKKNGLYGFINKKGETVIDFQYEYAGNFKDNYLAAVRKDGKYGAIDLEGNLVVPYKYKVELAMTTVPLTNKEYKAAAKEVESRKNRGQYDAILQKVETANREINAEVNTIPSYSQTDFREVGGTHDKGIEDKYGRLIVQRQYEQVNFDGTSAFYVVKNSLTGIVTADGMVIAPPVFNKVSAFRDGKANATMEGINGTIGYDGSVDDSFLSNLNQQGIRLAQAGKYQEAKSLFERILLLDRKNAKAANNLGFVYQMVQQPGYGTGLLELANQIDPTSSLIAANYKMAKKSKTGVMCQAQGDLFIATGVQSDVAPSPTQTKETGNALVEKQKDAVGAGASASHTVSSGGMSKDEYQSIYDRWAGKARQCYDNFKKSVDPETNKKGFLNYKKLMEQAKNDALLHGHTLKHSEVEDYNLE